MKTHNNVAFLLLLTTSSMPLLQAVSHDKTKRDDPELIARRESPTSNIAVTDEPVIVNFMTGNGLGELYVGTGNGARLIDIGNTNYETSLTLSSGVQHGVEININCAAPTKINTGAGAATISIGTDGSSTDTKIINIGGNAATGNTVSILGGSINGVNINAGSGSPTHINTDGSTGTVTIGSGNAGTSNAPIKIVTDGYNNPGWSLRATNAADGTVTYEDQASDSRIKTNITEIDPKTTLSRICNLRPIEFDFIPKLKEQCHVSGHNQRHAGFIAQEVQPIIPTVVTTRGKFIDGTPMYKIEYAELTAYLAAAIQALKKKYDTQRGPVDTNRLEGKIIDTQIADNAIHNNHIVSVDAHKIAGALPTTNATIVALQKQIDDLRAQLKKQ